MPKWTVLVEGQELPARPLVLYAAGVPPNDPTNSHQAVAILEKLGFQTRYQGNGSEHEHSANRAASQGGGLMAVAEIFEALANSVPRREWARVPRDLARNLDHYLYGGGKKK